VATARVVLTFLMITTMLVVWQKPVLGSEPLTGALLGTLAGVAGAAVRMAASAISAWQQAIHDARFELGPGTLATFLAAMSKRRPSL
jgi:hypothetical protein